MNTRDRIAEFYRSPANPDPAAEDPPLKTIKIHCDLLMGDTHRLAGSILDVDPVRARSLVEAGHASYHDRDRAPAEVEVAAITPSPRRAARPSSKAARRLAATTPGA